MKKIKLHNQFYPETTSVPNYFIDKYMPAANGAFVKVYLYLLRHLNYSDELSTEIIAEALDETEKDINRALTYWENMNLLNISRDNEQSIMDVSIIGKENETSSLSAPKSSVSKVANKLNEPDAKASDTLTSDALTSDALMSDVLRSDTLTPDTLMSNTLVSDTLTSDILASDTLTSDILASAASLKPNYSKAQISVLIEVDEIKWLMGTLEQYLERLLKPTDIQLILYLYEGLGFSAELILYLYEYCISMNKKSPQYIEAVAISWSKSGIDTVEKAESGMEIYNKNMQSVYKAFGMDRNLGSIEKQYVDKWFNVNKFEKAVIEEALNRTLLAIGKPDFKYADKIISNWMKMNVHTLNDVKNLDKEHQTTAKQAQPKKKYETASHTNNRFNSFPQRSHSNDYYTSLEKHLLNKNQ